MSSQINLKNQVPFESAGHRLDQVAAELFPEYSRSRLKNWVISGELTVNGLQVKPNYRLGGGETLCLEAVVQNEGDWEGQDIPLDILHEDESIIVLNKPAGLVVHPAAGNWDGTLLNGLVQHEPKLKQVPRAGIVHRLDKDTTGLMVVAKDIESQNNLVEQLQARTVKREYEAVVWGNPDEAGSIEGDIGRHPSTRTKMAVVDRHGKPARTHYAVKQYIGAFSHVRLKLETGRTHQIRVHMAYIGFPLVGDPLYGRKPTRRESTEYPEVAATTSFSRQALHAIQLGLLHPKTGEYSEWQSCLPEDMSELICAIEEQKE